MGKKSIKPNKKVFNKMTADSVITEDELETICYRMNKLIISIENANAAICHLRANMAECDLTKLDRV